MIFKVGECMKNILNKFLLIIGITSLTILPVHGQEKLVRGCKGWGFFAEFLWAVNHIHYCITHNKTPVIYWGRPYAYYSPRGYNGCTNCWEYYFEPVSQSQYKPGDALYTLDFYEDDKNFSTLWDYQQYVNNLHLLESDELIKVSLSNFHYPNNGAYPVGEHLYSKKFRKYIKNEILNLYVRIKKNIQKTIDEFYINNMKGKKTIGLHLRGRFLWNESPFVETKVFLDYVNQHFADGNTQFLVSTDQKKLLEAARNQLKGKVIFYESQRFEQSTAPVAGLAKAHPILGENVLIETILLSQCDHIVHGLSNVSTAALYFNPDVSHTLLY